MKSMLFSTVGVIFVAAVVVTGQSRGVGAGPGHALNGKRLFDTATFGGNGRTCETCHSHDTGTIAPQDAAKRFKQNPNHPLFLHDGSDDGAGTGVSRMLRDATILMTIPLPANVRLADDPAATSVVVRRGIPTTLNTPALDPVLMQDGRQPTLEAQAAGAILDHAQGVVPSAAELHDIAAFQQTNAFFSSPEVRRFKLGGPAPTLPLGRTAAEIRGRRFFEDVGPDPSDGFRPGLCSHCHSGPLLNQTNQFAAAFIGLPIPPGQRFISVGVSEFNAAGNPVRTFVFDQGTSQEFHLASADPGRALITGIGNPALDPTLEHVNAFKISPLRGIRHTAPYFHDNSARTLEATAAHYALFFRVVTGGVINLTPQDERDIVAYMKLLD